MLGSLLRHLFRRPSENSTSAIESKTVRHPERTERRHDENESGTDESGTIISREAVLDRQQKIIGYQFLLQKASHNRIQIQGRWFFHLYTEILVRNLVRANIFPLLKNRLIFIEVPDSFLDHPCLTELPPQNTLFILKFIKDGKAPGKDYLLTQTRILRKLGYRIGIPDPLVLPAYFHLLPEVDTITLSCLNINFERGANLVGHILRTAPQAAILMRDLMGMEDFSFCHKIGVTLFQGPFIISQEQWQHANLGSGFTHLTALLKKLREDADTHEIVALFKRDAAITLRLLRYINSAANGLQKRISSIEHALTLLGRAPLQRWLTLLLCSGNQPRADAVLETALVRARTMELLSTTREPAEREAIFLTGLLSLIDVILQQPIERALDALSIDSEIHRAILEDQGPYAPMLALARACEKMDTDSIISAAAACNIDPEEASARYMEALTWTLTLQQGEITGENAIAA